MNVTGSDMTETGREIGARGGGRNLELVIPRFLTWSL